MLILRRAFSVVICLKVQVQGQSCFSATSASESSAEELHIYMQMNLDVHKESSVCVLKRGSEKDRGEKAASLGCASIEGIVLLQSLS